MEKKSRYGAMEATIMAPTRLEKNKAKVSSTGAMVVSTRECGIMMIWAALVTFNGLINATLRVISRTVWCTATESTCGQMVAGTKVSTNPIRSKVMVLTLTRMAASIEASGKMVCRVEKVALLLLMLRAKYRHKAFGRTASSRTGFRKKSLRINSRNSDQRQDKQRDQIHPTNQNDNN